MAIIKFAVLEKTGPGFKCVVMHSHMKQLFTFVLALEHYLSGPLSHSQATLKQYNLEDPLSECFNLP